MCFPCFYPWLFHIFVTVYSMVSPCFSQPKTSKNYEKTWNNIPFGCFWVGKIWRQLWLFGFPNVPTEISDERPRRQRAPGFAKSFPNISSVSAATASVWGEGVDYLLCYICYIYICFYYIHIYVYVYTYICFYKYLIIYYTYTVYIILYIHIDHIDIHKVQVP